MQNDPAHPSGYALAPMFQVRMAGVPFDVLEPLATPRAVALARELAASVTALDDASGRAAAALRAGALPPRDRDRLLRAVGRRVALRDAPAGAGAEASAYAEALRNVEALRARYPEVLREELEGASRALREAARKVLPDYSVFASATVEELAFEIGLDAAEGRTNWRDRQRDRTLLMYVQRLATKNETLSAFGPAAWGRIDPAVPGVRLDTRPGLHREAYLERWVADAVVSAMNRDPSVRDEVAPRLHPAAALAAGALVRCDTGARLALDADTEALLRRCDGSTPAHALAPAERLAKLAADGAIVWAVECPLFELDRVGALAALVDRWRDGDARRRWAPLLAALAAIPAAFARETAPERRRDIVHRVRRMLADLGAQEAAAGQRVLYRAANPIGEDCLREGGLVLGEALARQVASAATPWLDLWRDTYAFIAHRANEKLRALHAALPSRDGAVPLPAYLRAADGAGLPLGTIGVPALAHVAFQEVKAAFRATVAGRADARSWSLSAEDCAFVRRRFEFARFDAFTWPSADLQLAARSADDVAAGRHRWVVAELHLAAAVLQHGVYWSCPDSDAFGRSLRDVAGPFCDWGLPADPVSHTMLHLETLADRWTYVGPSAMSPRWAAVRPADAAVVVAADGDVRVRAGGRDLGSFARSWVLGLGFHPFLLGAGAHTPRLEVGGVVVQRETWVVGAADLPHAPYAYGAPELVADVDRLRAARGIPRHVYVRPTEAAVRRLGAGGRDKDVKPIYVDLESHPFLDVLARWLAKHGELDVTEMLPAPDELLWREEGGRRTFELRTLVVPAR